MENLRLDARGTPAAELACRGAELVLRLAAVAAPLRVLLVEDDLDLAENLAEILEALGCEPAVSSSAEEALRSVSRGGFDGVITDFRLPGQSGLELMRELRQRGFEGAIVMMSGFMDHDAVRGALRGGALAVLPKPVDLELLSTLVREFGRPGARVLIVDDDRALAENIVDALAAHGLEAIVAGSEREVIDQQILTRVALVDLRLPDACGLDVAERLQARDPRIKILFMSAYNEEAQRAIAEKHGSGGHTCIEKPFDVEHLVERIRQAANG